uniref:DEG/ENaC family ion channel ENaC4 n=1 Tax=Platynereis dumerilii TaxID=6359 RepID=A0A2S1B6I2_PLADU|nr:DEG/ENaC family ion channel ENaC4 [Platynereis dumerilii]
MAHPLHRTMYLGASHTYGADMRNHYHNHSPRPLKPVRPNRKTMDVHRVFREFADSTSMHGVPRIINARSLAARVFWSITCICAFGIFLWQCVILLQRFYSYPKKVNVEVVQRPVRFPSVSFCNTDHLDLVVVKRLEEMLLESDNITYGNDTHFMKFKEAYQAFWDSSSFFFQPYLQHVKPYEKAMTHMLAAYSRLGLIANLGVDLASQGGIEMRDFIVNCRFMGEPCDIEKSFVKFFDPYFFNCFTFDPSTILSSKTTRLQGAEYGLTIILFTGSAGQLTKKSEFEYVIPGMEEADGVLASGRGARVLVHSPGTAPRPASSGFDAPPEFSVSLGVRARENVRIDKPWGNCSFGNMDSKFKYTLEDCQNTCLQRNIMQKCGCIDNKISIPSYTKGLPFCLTLPTIPYTCYDMPLPEKCAKIMDEWTFRMDCRKEVYENLTMKDPDAMDNCGCFPPCNDIIYEASYSLSTIPEQTEENSAFYSIISNFLSSLAEPKKKLLNDLYKLNKKDGRIRGYIGRINVFIADSNVVKTTEAPDYEAIRLISDIGGQLGLWIGISVMTLFEVMQLTCDICRFLSASGRQKSRDRRRARPTRVDRVADRDVEIHFEVGDKLTAV